MSSSPPEDKVRANRGQKRNFSFESHPTSTTSAGGRDAAAVTSPSSLFMPSVADSSGRFDIASIVAKMDIGVGISGNAHPANIAEESASDQFDDTGKDDFSSTNESSNNTDSSTGESMLQRASYIPYPASNSEDIKSFSPVDLQVSNLDQTIDQREMKKVLVALFSEHVTVLNVSVFFQSDGNMAASVRVGSPQEAQVAIAQLHRKKLGFKRILISNNHVNNFNPNMLRSKVGALLAEVPNGRLQLFKFREMYEKRYHDSIGVSDLYKMKDVVNISEDQSGRMIQLQPNWYSMASQHQQRMPNMAIDFQSVNSTLFAPSRRQDSLLGSSVVGAPQVGMQNQSVIGNSCPPILDSAFCKIHCSEAGENKIGWAEKENGTLLPNVNASLAVLGPNVKNLIQTHGGALPLASLAVCYAAVYPPGFQVDNHEGVPLEHLVSCVRGVAIQQSVSGIKQLILVGITPPHQGFIGTTFTGRTEEGKISSVFTHYRQLSGSASSASSSASSSLTNLTNFGLSNQVCPQQPTAAAPLAGQLALFSRELVDLLKTSPGCRMPFSKFIPAYHHHFGRQCRVADYGYTKLKELFEAIPHVVQIMGEGSKALITLAHRAQVKRFTNDLLKVLKAQPSKQISILDLPLCFEKSLTRHFKISDYGVCDMEDILHEVSETTVVLCGSGDDMMISIPKREQTQSEMERTHQFAQECIELLRHAPDCRLNFNKFIPAYHHHFGRQCRVSDYGFSKLIELFEAIPTTVEITEDADGERLLQLTDSERLAVLGDQITSLVVHSSSNSVNINNNNNIKSSNKQSLKLEDLEEAYMNQFGYQLRPDTYGQSTIVDLLGKLNQSLRVEKDENGSYQVRLIDRSYIKALANQVRDILATDPEGNLSVKDFSAAFQERHYVVPDLVQMRSDLVDWVEFYEVEEGDDAPLIDLNDDAKDISEDSSNSTSEVDESRSSEPVVGKKKVEYIRLKPLQLCVVKIQNLLKDYQDKILMSEFEAAFAEKYEAALCPGQYGYPSLLALIQSPVMVEEHFLIRGRGARKMIWYMRDGAGPAFSIANLPLPTPTGRGLIQEPSVQNYSFQDRVTSAINSFTAQNRYPGYRQDSLRFGQASSNLGSGRNWTTQAPIGRSTASFQPSYTRSIRGAQQPLQQSQMQAVNNRNRFVYPPPVQNQLFNYPMGLMQHQPQSDGGSSYWGNLAQFGLFPNGRGGVAPIGSGAGHGLAGNIGQVEHTSVRPQSMAVGSSVCGRGLGGSLVPPPPLQRLSPGIGSPIQQGISSLLPTPHSPSPMMSAGTSPFMFPPTYWPSNNNMASSPGSYAFK